MTTAITYLENVLVPHKRVCIFNDANTSPKTVADLAPQGWTTPYIAFLNARPILRSDWNTTLSNDDTLSFIDVNALPQGGGGGGGSDPLRTVLMVALIVNAPMLAGEFAYMMGGGEILGSVAGLNMLQAGIVLAGSALINAVIPPPKPTSSQQAASMAEASPTYSLAAQGNSARISAAIPEHFGRMVGFPDFAAMPYTEYAGNEQYIYQLLCIGRGSYDVEAVRIEDTPVSSFTEIESEIILPGQAVTKYPFAVTTSGEVSGQELKCRNATYLRSGTTVTVTYAEHGVGAGAQVYLAVGTGAVASGEYTVVSAPTPNTFTVTTAASGSESGNVTYSVYVGGFIASASTTTANYIGLDFIAGKGLFYANDDGSFATRNITVEIQVRQVNDLGAPITGWSVLGTKVYSGATNTPQRYSERYAISGRLQIRVRRTDAEDQSTRAGHNIVWGTMRAYLTGPNTFGDVTLIAMRMRASNNLSSQSSRKINVIATRKLPIWDGTSWSAPTATRSIAWAIAYACKQVGLPDNQIDLATLKTLDSIWAARGTGDTFDGRFDSFLNFWEAVTKIAQAGRTKPFLQAGVMRFHRDQAQATPVAMFSMRNIIKGSFSVDYLMPTAETADSVRATYFDNSVWSAQSVTTTRVGLDSDPVQNPAKIDLFGVTNRIQAMNEAVYQAACNRYRRKIIKFSTEMDGFIPSFGDLVSIQHDMPGWGQGGEVIAWNSGTKTATLSEPLTWGTGTHYIAFRKKDGSVDGPYIVTAGTDANQVVLDTLPANTPYIGTDYERTHYSFGWAETYRQRAKILSVRPASLTRVAIECINEDDNVHTAEAGVIVPPINTSQLAGVLTLPTVQNLLVTSLFRSRHAFEATWSPSPGASFYIVEISPDGTNWKTLANVYTPSYTGVLYNGTSTILRVAAMGLAKGPWAVALLTTLPIENVNGLSYNTSEAGTLISWNPSVDTDYFDTTIKQGVSWESGVVIYKGAANNFLWVRPGTGAYTVWAKHNDASGASSELAKSLTVTYTQVAVDNNAVTLTDAGQLIGAGGGTIDIGKLGGTLGHLQFNDDLLVINMDGADIDVEMRFGRTTGGSASLTWNGDLIQASRPFKPVEIGINNISATEPATPFAGQVWLQP